MKLYLIPKTDKTSNGEKEAATGGMRGCRFIATVLTN